MIRIEIQVDPTQKNVLLDKIELIHEKELLNAYKKARSNIKAELALLEEKGILTYTDMMNYNRMVTLQNIIVEEMKSLAKATGETLTAEQTTLFKESYNLTGIDINGAMGTNIDFTMLPKKAINSAVDNPLDFVGYIQRNNDNTQKIVNKMNQEILTGLIQGEGYAKIAEAMTNVFDMGYTEAVRIARTEGHRAREAGTQQGYEEAISRGVTMKKQWIASMDNRVRDPHAAAQGQIVDNDEPFIVDGEELMYPGAPGGSAGNVINCRCSTRAIITDVKGEALQNVKLKGLTYEEWKAERA